MCENSNEIVENYLIEELSEENGKLVNDSIFANKCLNILIELKTIFDLSSDKIKKCLESNERQKFEKLIEDINEIVVKVNVKSEENNFNFCENEDNVEEGDNFEPKFKTFDPSVTSGRECEPTEPMDDKEENNRDNSEKIIRCHYTGCDQTFSSRRQYNKHNNTVHSKSKYEELFQSSNDDSGQVIADEDCDRTKDVNNVNEYFMCDHPGCDYKDYDKYLVRSHQISQHYSKTFETIGIEGKSEKCTIDGYAKKDSVELLRCDFAECKYETTNRYNLRKHKICCHSEKNFVCTHPDCDFRTYNRSRLKRHTQSHGPGFECTYDGCKGIYTTKECLLQHMKSHTMKMKIKCSYEGCDKVFRAKASLNEHINSKHTKSKQWHCEWPGCDYSTYLPNKLSQHSVVHSNDYKFVCDYTDCNAKYKIKKDLNKHKLRVHDKVRRFSCSWPGCTFTAFDNQGLKSHEIIHTGEKPFGCDWPGCQYRTNKKSTLKCQHMKKHIKN